MPDLDLVFVVDTETVSLVEEAVPVTALVLQRDEGLELSEEVLEVLAASPESPTDEYVPLAEEIIVVQVGELVFEADAIDLETEALSLVGISEVTDFVLAAFEEAAVEDLELAESVVTVIVSEPAAEVESPEEGPPPPETVPPLPDIVFAQYQEDGLIVRVYHIDDTETSTAVDDTTTRQGIQLQAWVADGNTIHPYELPTPSRYNVDQERDRRLALGIMITLPGGRMMAVQTRGLEDFRNITFLVTTAATVPGDQIFRDAYDILQTISAPDMIDLGAQLTGLVSEYYEAGWTLKDMSEIPFDYFADMYWPDHSYPLTPPSGYM